MEEDPDPATEMPAFVDSLYTRLEHVSITQAEGEVVNPLDSNVYSDSP